MKALKDYIIAGKQKRSDLITLRTANHDDVVNWIKTLNDVLELDANKIIQALKRSGTTQFNTKDNAYTWTVVTSDKVQLLSQ